MEKQIFEVKNSINPKDWIIPNTNIFIMPVLVTMSSNPGRNYVYNIRHGMISDIDGKCLSDNIEDGTDFCGGFKTMDQVIEFSLNESKVTSEIFKYVKLALPQKAYDIWLKENPNSPYNSSRFDETSEKRWQNISTAWGEFHKALVKGLKDGLFKDNNDKLELISKLNIGMQ